MPHFFGLVSHRLDMKARMSDRTIEIDQQSAHGRAHQWRVECSSELLCHRERPRIVTAMRIQHDLVLMEQISIRGGNAVAAVLAGDQEKIGHPYALAAIR